MIKIFPEKGFIMFTHQIYKVSFTFFKTIWEMLTSKSYYKKQIMNLIDTKITKRFLKSKKKNERIQHKSMTENN